MEYRVALLWDSAQNPMIDIYALYLVWISQERLATALHSNGRLHSAPDLTIEILSPGSTNEYRDREVKLKLYSRQGVLEYWVVNWQERSLESINASGQR